MKRFIVLAILGLNLSANDTAVVTTDVNQTQGEFKNSVMNKVDEKMDKLTKLLEQRETQNFNSSQSSSLALPIPIGTLMITDKTGRLLYKEAYVVDENGKRFILNNENNSIVKRIDSDYITFKETDKKMPLLVTPGDSKEEIKVTNTMPITTIAPNLKSVPTFDKNILRELNK